MNLEGKNIVVFDLETSRPVEQCSNGWKSLDEMGISVGCAFDYRENRFRIFMKDNLQSLVDRLNEPGTTIVAFNHVSFDNQLLRACGYNLKPDEALINYDMLQISREGARGSQFSKGFKLDDHLRVLSLPMKTGAGAMAPILFQEGKLGELVDYCVQDVSAEKSLFEWIQKNGTLACEFKRQEYPVRRCKEAHA